MRNLLILVLLAVFSISTFAETRGTKAPTNDQSKPIEIANKVNSVWMDDMNANNSIAGLEARGWVVVDVDAGGTSATFFQGVASNFTAYEGPDTGYVSANYNGGNSSGVIDHWLISPEITVSAGDTLSFWQKSPDGSSWPDSIAISYSPTAGTTPADFTEEWEYIQTSITGWAKWSGTFATGGTIRFAIRYYITDNVTNSNLIGLDYFEIATGSSETILTVAEAREDLDNDFVPDRLGDTVTVEAMVISPNYQTSNHSYYLSDGTAGITTFLGGTTTPELALGDVYKVTGTIGQFNGLTQLNPLEEASFVQVSTGGTVAAPTVLTLAEYKANPEMYESSLIGFMNLSLASGTWPASGSTTLQVTDGVDTLALRIDSDTDIDGSPEPTWPVDIVGLGSQFDSSSPYDGGYQLLPRYTTDFLPAGSLPVELTSFTAAVSGNSIVLNWVTATETNNSGFSVERSENGTDYQAVGFVDGYGTTVESKAYIFTDSKVSLAVNYTYRLKQIDFDGTYSYSSLVEVTLGMPENFELEQNYPNPFNPTTNIKFTLPEAANVKLTVFNTIGQEVANIANKSFEAGVHNVEFNAANLNSGVYLYRIEAGNFVQIKKMMLLK